MEVLRNLTILVACSEKKMVELAAGLKAMGASVIAAPVIEIREIAENPALDRALAAVNEYSWIIFTSAYAADIFMHRLQMAGRGDAPLPDICAIGPATARVIETHGRPVALLPDDYVAEGILEALGKRSGGLPSLAGKRVLLPRAREGREKLPAALAEAGIRVDVIPCYDTVRAELDGDAVLRLRAARPDVMVFTSSSTVKSLMEIIGPECGGRMLLQSLVAALGPITARTVESYGKRPEIVPEENTIASLLAAIRAYYSAGGRERQLH